MGPTESAPEATERRAKAPLEPNFSRYGALFSQKNLLTSPHPTHRPHLLIEDCRPTHLFCATAEGPGLDLKDATRSWNTVIPLAR